MRISDWSSDVCSSDLSSVPAITQNPDIRYLGRLLGDVIRAYGGEKIYKQTEYIRSASVDRARGLHGADVVDTGLDALSLDDTLSFVRGFMLFSMLANLAEDRQGVAAEPGADVASAVEKLDSHGLGRDARSELLSHALIVRSEDRRVGKEWASTWRSWWSPYP